MIKFFGCVMIISASAYAGFLCAHKLNCRLRIIKKLHRMVCEIIIMLNSSFLTVGEIIARLAECSEFSSFDFLKVNSASPTIREDIVKKVEVSSVMSVCCEDEKSQLKNFFKDLGSTEINGQLALAELYKKELSVKIENLSEQTEKKCRLYKAMGVLSGTFAAVILI